MENKSVGFQVLSLVGCFRPLSNGFKVYFRVCEKGYVLEISLLCRSDPSFLLHNVFSAGQPKYQT